jgi:hypothetical protein
MVPVQYSFSSMFSSFLIDRSVTFANSIAHHHDKKAKKAYSRCTAFWHPNTLSPKKSSTSQPHTSHCRDNTQIKHKPTSPLQQGYHDTPSLSTDNTASLRQLGKQAR